MLGRYMYFGNRRYINHAVMVRRAEARREVIRRKVAKRIAVRRYRRYSQKQKAAKMLKGWCDDHKDYPCPTDVEKKRLSALDVSEHQSEPSYLLA